MSAPELKPCPFCGGGETRIDPQGQTWRGQGYSDPICWRLVHFCKGILPDGYVTNRMELRARTQEQCIEAWNTRANLCDPTQDERVKALVKAASYAAREIQDYIDDDTGIGPLEDARDTLRAALRDMEVEK